MPSAFDCHEIHFESHVPLRLIKGIPIAIPFELTTNQLAFQENDFYLASNTDTSNMVSGLEYGEILISENR